MQTIKHQQYLEQTSQTTEEEEFMPSAHEETTTNENICQTAELYKTTITAFDVLTERCTELIDLFDQENQKTSSNVPTSNEANAHESGSSINKFHHLSDQISPSEDTSPHLRHLHSAFLDRTLTFNSSMSSSALLSSSRTSFLFPNASLEADVSIEKRHGNESIKSYLFALATNDKSLFGKSVSEFLSCTNNSKETNPSVLMSNTRQFMDGIKNYLLRSSGNADLKSLIEQERANLKQTCILNIDSIIEDCLQSIVLRPLKTKIYYLLVDWLIGDSSIILMSKNMKQLNGLTESDCLKYLSVKGPIAHKPASHSLKQIRTFYSKMQCEYSPLIKLKYLLFIVNELLTTVEEFEGALNDLAHLDTVKFMPVVIYSLCKCNMYALQIELDYIWSLSNKKILTNETVYYLTLMSSACYVIKNLEMSKIAEAHAQRCVIFNIIFNKYL